MNEEGKKVREAQTGQFPWTNPYVPKVAKYPDRIFEFKEWDTDITRLREVISQYQSLKLELCSGSGNHLVELAALSPQAACLGMELRFKRTVRTLEKSEARGVTNSFVLRTDARRFAAILPPKAVSELYVHFPDPWAKRRSQKHRLLDAEFLDNLDCSLSDTGLFQFKSDHAEYFKSFTELLRADHRFKIVEYSEDYRTETQSQTEFERLWRSQKLPIHFMRAVRS